jgi:hypothetical protein
MKRIIMMMAMSLMFLAQITFGQKIDEERMQRDIEVAENVLGTLIKQQFEQQRMFFPLEITGSYQPGYGVTFRLPADYTTPVIFNYNGNDNAVIWNEGDSYVWRSTPAAAPAPPGVEGRESPDVVIAKRAPGKTETSLNDKKLEKERARRKLDMDSVKEVNNSKIIEAAKSFIVDYGDLIGQLPANEKIIITNQGDRPRIWVGKFFNNPKRTHLVIEGLKSDAVAYKQGKISRDQAAGKIKVVNTESSDKVEPDMEMLSTIFNRLYRTDLSKTYFIEENIYYERLNDFGAVYYMQVYSTIPISYQRFAMPTLGLEDIDQATRDKKVKEIYPQFEQELKDNMLEYGRTLKSLKDEESLIINVTLTKCVGCAIPSSLELTLKASVLKEYGAGKIDKPTALNKIAIKKGANQ